MIETEIWQHEIFDNSKNFQTSMNIAISHFSHVERGSTSEFMKSIVKCPAGHFLHKSLNIEKGLLSNAIYHLNLNCNKNQVNAVLLRKEAWYILSLDISV